MSTLTLIVYNCSSTLSATVYRAPSAGAWINTGVTVGTTSSSNPVSVLPGDTIELRYSDNSSSFNYTIPETQQEIPSVLYFPFNPDGSPAAPKQGNCSLASQLVYFHACNDFSWNIVERANSNEPWFQLNEDDEPLTAGDFQSHLVYNGFQVSLVPSFIDQPPYPSMGIYTAPNVAANPPLDLYFQNPGTTGGVGTVSPLSCGSIQILTQNCYPFAFDTLVLVPTNGATINTTLSSGNPFSQVLINNTNPFYEISYTASLFNSILNISSGSLYLDPTKPLPTALVFSADGTVGTDSSFVCPATTSVTLFNCNRNSVAYVRQRLDMTSPWLPVVDSSGQQVMLSPKSQSKPLTIISTYSLQLVNTPISSSQSPTFVSGIAMPNNVDYSQTIYFSANKEVTNLGCTETVNMANCYTSTLSAQWRSNSSSPWVPAGNTGITGGNSLPIKVPADTQVQLTNGTTITSGIADLSQLNPNLTVFFPTDASPNNVSCAGAPPESNPLTFWQKWWWLVLAGGILLILIIGIIVWSVGRNR